MTIQQLNKLHGLILDLTSKIHECQEVSLTKPEGDIPTALVIKELNTRLNYMKNECMIAGCLVGILRNIESETMSKNNIQL